MEAGRDPPGAAGAARAAGAAALELFDPQTDDEASGELLDHSPLERLRGHSDLAQLGGFGGPDRRAAAELPRDRLRIEGGHFEAAGFFVAVEDGRDAAELRNLGPAVRRGGFGRDLPGDGFEQAHLRAGGVQRARFVGGFERAAERAGEDGERAGDGEQQHRAGVVGGRAPQIPGAEQRGQPAPGGGEPRGGAHQRGEEPQHGQADHSHQHCRSDDGQPFEPRLADQRRVDGAAGELQLEDQQRTQADNGDIDEDALPPGVGRAPALAPRGNDRLPAGAVGGRGLRGQRQRARAERDIPGKRRQADGQQAAAERLIERRDQAEQGNEPHADQRSERGGGQRQHGRFDEMQKRDIAPPRAAAAQPGGVLGALLSKHRRGDHGVDEHRADELQDDHHQRALGELEAFAEVREQRCQRRALHEVGQLLGEARLHHLQPLSGALRGFGGQPGGVEPVALQQGNAKRGGLVGKAAEQVCAGCPEAQLGLAGGEREKAGIEHRPAADVGGRLEQPNDDGAALGRRAEPEGLRAQLVAHGQAEGLGLAAFERDFDRSVGAGRLRQAAVGERGAIGKISLYREDAVQPLRFAARLIGRPDDVAAASQRADLADDQSVRGGERFGGEHAADLIDGGAIGGEAGLQEAQVQVGGLGVREQPAQA